MRQTNLLGIGECMVELHDGGAERLRLSYGGDVLNTLVYAQRSGAQTAFATVTGDDHYGRWLRASWAAEGIDCALVRHDAGTAPALYIIRNTAAGERRFHYWRSASPFRALLQQQGYVAALAAAVAGAPWIYLSGITLAMLDEASRATLLSMLESAVAGGVRLAIDPNYRPTLWPDAATARRWLRRAYACATIALPSLEDEQALGDVALDAISLAGEVAALGVEEVVVKDGERGAQVFTAAGVASVAAVNVAEVVDTTAAGDAFNGAYLAARIGGSAVAAAAAAGARTAAQVVQQPGAIMPAAIT